MALSDSPILFEIKVGPFSLLSEKELEHWAPDEDSPYALYYLHELRNSIFKSR